MTDKISITPTRKKPALTQYISKDTKNMLMSGGFDVDKYHDPSPMNAHISNLILLLAGIMEEIPLEDTDETKPA